MTIEVLVSGQPVLLRPSLRRRCGNGNAQPEGGFILGIALPDWPRKSSRDEFIFVITQRSPNRRL
jgi:hypothetical protein